MSCLTPPRYRYSLPPHKHLSARHPAPGGIILKERYTVACNSAVFAALYNCVPRYVRWNEMCPNTRSIAYYLCSAARGRTGIIVFAGGSP